MASGSTLYPQGDTASLRGREEIFYPAAAGDSSPAAAAVAAEAEVDQARAWTSGIPGTYPIAQDSELDEWKDYSCSTAWEYFINDVDNAIGKLVGADKCSPVGEEKQLAGEPRRRLQRPERLVMPLTYKGRSYVLRRLKHGRKRDCRQVRQFNTCQSDMPWMAMICVEGGGEERESRTRRGDVEDYTDSSE